MSKKTKDPFDEEYMNDIAGQLQNIFHQNLCDLSNPISGLTNKTSSSLLDTIEYPCWEAGKNENKLVNKKIQIQIILTKDENEFIDFT